MAQWIKSDVNIDFVGRRRKYWSISIAAVVLSIVALIANVFIRGSALNYGTDFRGGSQIQIEFSKALKSKQVRDALKASGYSGAEVVRMHDDTGKHLFMLRLTEVTSFSLAQQAKAKELINAGFDKKLKRLDYSEGSDKVYVVFNKNLASKASEEGKDISDKLKQVLAKGEITVHQARRFGRAQDNTFEVTLGALGAELSKSLEHVLGKGIVKDIPSAETVGAKMGRQLRDDGMKSVLYALLLMLVYIAFRFDFRYAPGAVVALAHDVTITVGLFAVTWAEFSLPVVAALLTIAGYSINDTIVVFDRIRENVARLRDRKFPLVVNASINETLSRTLLTSLTTLFTCVAIWVLGTGILRSFAFALTAGVVVGTYSSIFIASPLVVVLNERFAAAKRKARAA